MPKAVTQTENSQPTDDVPRAHTTLQKSMDDLTARIADHPSTSFAIRLVRAHRAEVSEDTCRKAIEVVRQSLADAEAAYEKALSTPPKKRAAVGIASRAQL